MSNPLLFITPARLAELQACDAGQVTFAQKFPDGVDARACMEESVRAGNWGNLRWMKRTLRRILADVPGGAEALAEALEGLPDGPPPVGGTT